MSNHIEDDNEVSLVCLCVPLGGSPPPRNLQSWVTCCGLGLTPDESVSWLPHDIYAFGTQDNPQGEKEWMEHIRATLKSATHIDFKQVRGLWTVVAVFNVKVILYITALFPWSMLRQRFIVCGCIN